MEPPQLAELIIFILVSLSSLVLASYEATFTVLSRSSLEKLVETGIPRAGLMLRIHEPRHRLQLMARVLIRLLERNDPDMASSLSQSLSEANGEKR